MPAPTPSARVRRVGAVLAALALTATGCATSATPSQPGAARPTAYGTPVHVTNCDRPLTLERPPQRIVSMNDHVTEVLLEMGVGDRIVGMGYGKASPRPKYAAQWAKIPKLADEYPSAEQLLDAEPDLVVGGMSSAFDEKRGRSRDQLAEKKVPTFLFSEYCGKGLATLDVLTTDYAQLGVILGQPDQGVRVGQDVQRSLEELRHRLQGTTPVPTFVYDSGEKEPLTVGGVGVGHLIVTAAGAKNLFDEGTRPYAKASWEQISERAPQAIVVLDYGKTSATDKIEFLKNHPVMRTTPAVRAGRFVVVPLDDFFESPRLVGSAQTIARFLHPDRIPG
ncbi:ABC transporter substrate-binding protein [Mariniluteicoccus flavus]